jgi:hypothetical protein
MKHCFCHVLFSTKLGETSAIIFRRYLGFVGNDTALKSAQ